MSAITETPAPLGAGVRVPRKRRRGRAGRWTAGRIGAYVGVGAYALMLTLPLYWLFISAFKPTLQIFSDPFVPTFASGLDNIIRVWNTIFLGQAMLNSLYTTAGALVLTLIVAVPASYAIARSKGKVATLFERAYAVGFLIPGFAALIPSLLIAIQLGLFHKREFLLVYLPAAAQPLTVILLTQFMRTVPAELEESARLDGASRLRILTSVYLPLVAPGIATVTILNFINFWNEYIYALIIVGLGVDTRTLQVALPTLRGNQGITDFSLITAGTLLSVLPVFIVYIVLNRRLENALVQGALKG